jgi:hypothetical protein
VNDTADLLAAKLRLWSAFGAWERITKEIAHATLLSSPLRRTKIDAAAADIKCELAAWEARHTAVDVFDTKGSTSQETSLVQHARMIFDAWQQGLAINERLLDSLFSASHRLLLLGRLDKLQPRVPASCTILEDLLWSRGPPVQEQIQDEPVGEDDAEREDEVMFTHCVTAMPTLMHLPPPTQVPKAMRSGAPN